MLAADPASSLQAATKQYVDTRVSRTGDTLTGALVLAANPTTTLQAATRDMSISVRSSGVHAQGAAATLTGSLIAGRPIRRVRCRQRPSSTSIRVYRAPATH